MSWTHYSKVAALGVLLAIAVGVAGTAAAATVSGDAPEQSEVGTEVEMETTISDPFVDQPDSWTLNASTELENATWFVEIRDGGDNTVTQTEGSGQTIQQDLSLEENHDEVTVRVTGEVPEIPSDDYNYEEMESENYTAMEIQRAGAEDGSRLATFSSHRYTEASLSAREAIDSAQAAVDSSGNSDAQAQLDQAISAYNGPNPDFELAEELAVDAENTANQAGQTRQLMLIGGGIVVALVVIGGIVFWYRGREDETHRLQ